MHFTVNITVKLHRSFNCNFTVIDNSVTCWLPPCQLASLTLTMLFILTVTFAQYTLIDYCEFHASTRNTSIVGAGVVVGDYEVTFPQN